MSLLSDVIADQDQTLLRLKIDGDWSAEEFSSLIADIEFLVRVWITLCEQADDSSIFMSPQRAKVITDAEQSGDVDLAAFVERFVLKQMLVLHAKRPGRKRDARTRSSRGVGWWSRRFGGAVPGEEPRQDDKLSQDEFYFEMFSVDVRRVRFESPGFVDLGGFGKIAGHIKELIFKVIDLKIYAQDRAINRELAMQKVVSEKIKNAEKILNLGNKIGLDQETKAAILLELIRTGDRLSELEHKKKLTKIETIDE